jgi:hypothetical protein
MASDRLSWVQLPVPLPARCTTEQNVDQGWVQAALTCSASWYGVCLLCFLGCVQPICARSSALSNSCSGVCIFLFLGILRPFTGVISTSSRSLSSPYVGLAWPVSSYATLRHTRDVKQRAWKAATRGRSSLDVAILLELEP